MKSKACAPALTILVWSAGGFVRSSLARTWKDIALIHDVGTDGDPNVDRSGQAFLQAVFDLEFLQAYPPTTPSLQSSSPTVRLPSTDAPSPSPSVTPSPPPTNEPTASPTLRPSHSPSMKPSVSPTRSPAPSASPTISRAPSESPTNSPEPSASPTALATPSPTALPTLPPTARPTPLPTPRPTLDASLERGYFDYNVASQYGPPNWANVEKPDNFYWNEFDANGFGVWKGLLQDHLDDNMCSKGQFQSPIDVRENGADCKEFHEIRDNAGEFALSDDDVEKRIESNKLRLVYKRRACPDVDNPQCRNHDLPLADFPNGWPKTADVLHIDFKIPAEHKIRGESFDAEMQIFHIHERNKRVAALSTMIRVQDGGFNPILQDALNAFQRVYDENRALCALTGDNPASRSSQTKPTMANQMNYLSQAPDFETSFNESNFGSRALKNIWNPYHERLIPTIHFFRYDGSLTEPPCSEFVSWFISDKPMIVNMAQLEQWRNIQFTNVDRKDCRKSSVHSVENGVARPVQATHDRDVWVCTPSDFVKDP